MRFRAKDSAIREQIALLRANHIARVTSDFKIDFINVLTSVRPEVRKGEGLRRDRNYMLKKLRVNRSKKKPPNKVMTTKQIQDGGCSQMTCDVLHATNKENLSLTAFQPIEFSYRNS